MSTGASLKGKTLFITGASRGIGKAIGLRAAQGRRQRRHRRQDDRAAPEARRARSTRRPRRSRRPAARPWPCIVDIRDEEQVHAAVNKAVETFGGIDILVNNASAISLTDTLGTTMKRYDLMHSVNTRGTFLCSQACLPHLLKGKTPHILNISPPLNMEARWFAPHVAYTMAKFGMSMCVLGMAGRVPGQGRRERALAADGHRHVRGAEPPRRRRDREPGAHARTSWPTPPTRSSRRTCPTRGTSPSTRTSFAPPA